MKLAEFPWKTFYQPSLSRSKSSSVGLCDQQINSRNQELVSGSPAQTH